MGEYDSLDELPKGVKENLPQHAQEIYRAAYNSAHDDHEDADERMAVAHKIAWGAVKQKYEKTGNGWQEKDNDE